MHFRYLRNQTIHAHPSNTLTGKALGFLFKLSKSLKTPSWEAGKEHDLNRHYEVLTHPELLSQDAPSDRTPLDLFAMQTAWQSH